AGRDVGVVRAGQVAGLCRAQGAEAVRQDLQHAVGLHALAVAGQHLEQGEDHVLLAGTGHALVDVQLLGDLQQLVRRHALEVAQRILREALRHARVRTARVLRLVVRALVLHAAVFAETLALAVAAVAEPLPAVAAATFARVAFGAALLAATLGGRLGLATVGLLAAVLSTLRGRRGCGRRRSGRCALTAGRCRRHRQRRLDGRRRGGGIGGGSGGSGGIGRLGDTLAGALLGGCVIAPGRFRLGVLGQDWNSSLADASARRAGGGLVWEGCAGCACLAAMPRSGGTAAASGRPDPPTLAPGSWRRQAAPGEQGPAVQAPSVAGEWVACRAAQAARVLSIIWVSWP